MQIRRQFYFAVGWFSVGAGVLGMFLGVPVCAALQTLGKYLVDRRLRKRDMPLDAAAYVRKDLQQEVPAETDDKTE